MYGCEWIGIEQTSEYWKDMTGAETQVEINTPSQETEAVLKGWRTWGA